MVRHAFNRYFLQISSLDNPLIILFCRYDRNKLSLKEIHNCQYVSCMNPTAGSFTINPRLQRHFCVFAICFPSGEALTTIYKSILSQHLTNPEYKFPSYIAKLCDNVVAATVALHHKTSQIFLPTAVKFHYIFNLRDISNVFQVSINVYIL